MTDDDPCPRCGADTEYAEICAWGRPVRLIRLSCCLPPLTVAQLRRREEDDWLRRQQALAEAT